MHSGTRKVLKTIERDPGAGQKDLPDITISKDILLFFLYVASVASVARWFELRRILGTLNG